MNKFIFKERQSQYRYDYLKQVWRHLMSFPFPYNYILIFTLIASSIVIAGYTSYEVMDLVRTIVKNFSN